MDIDKFINHVERGLVGASHLFFCLLEFARISQDDAIKLIETLDQEKLVTVWEFLTLYPETEFGWSILPSKRSEFTHRDLNDQELFDLGNSKFQEDKLHVVF